MIDRGFEVPIDTVDRWRLATPVRWLIMRVFARDCVEQVALQHYVRALLETHRWSLARVERHPEPRHVYAVFGVPSQSAESAASAVYRTTI